MKLTSGARVGAYIIASPLGAGGMGEVYRARDERIGRDVAIKVLPEEFAADRDRLKRLQQEAHAAGILNHPNLLTVHELGVHEESPFIVTELLEGRTLREVLNKGPLPVRKVIDYGVQIANGLAAAHEKGIVHRDLKPENLFVTEDDRIKILDFGLAKLTVADAVAESDGPTLQRETDSGVILGTVGYMSPEQVRGDRVDACSDLFSLGAILYEMLTGERAFHGDSRVETLNAILKEEPPGIANVRVPAPLQRSIRHCLEKHPRDRFQSARDIAYDLESSYAAAEERRTTPERRILIPLVITGLVVVGAAAVALKGVNKPAGSPVPTIRRLTYRQLWVEPARFSPDGQTIIYSANSSSEPFEVFSVRSESPESRNLGYSGARILSVSPSGELALQLGARPSPSLFGASGILARVHMSGSAPREVLDSVDGADWSPQGDRLAVVRSVQEKYRIEFPPGRVLYETSGWVSDARISPDGKSIAFLDHPSTGDDGGSVALVFEDRKVRRLASGLVTSQGLAWRPDGREIWFTAGRTGIRTLNGVNLDGRERVIYAAPQSLILHDIARDGQVLVSMGEHRMRMTLLRSGESGERDLTWLDYGNVADISRDGKLVLFYESGQGGGPNYSVYVRPTDGSPAIRLGEGNSRKFSPDGRFVLVSLHSPHPRQLAIYPVGAGEARQITNDSIQHDGFACWFPDGKRILFAGREPRKGWRLYVQHLDGGKPKPMPEGISLSGADAVSPDGRTLLVRSDHKLALLSMDGGNPRALPESVAGARALRWNTTGDGFYFRWPNEPGPKIYEFNLKSEKIRALPFRSPSERRHLYQFHVITPDGRTLVSIYESGTAELYVVSGLK